MTRCHIQLLDTQPVAGACRDAAVGPGRVRMLPAPPPGWRRFYCSRCAYVPRERGTMAARETLADHGIAFDGDDDAAA